MTIVDDEERWGPRFASMAEGLLVQPAMGMVLVRRSMDVGTSSLCRKDTGYH